VTGKFEYKTGCNFDHGAMHRPIWEQSYPKLLKKAGYSIAFAGKFGFEVCEKPEEKGHLPESEFDMWGGGPGQTSYVTAKNSSMKKYAKEHPHSTLSYAAFSKDYFKKASKEDKPFCLSISFKAPHKPATPDSQFNDVYKGKKFTKPKNYGRDYSQHFSEQSKQGRQYERFHSWNYSDKYDEVMAVYHQQIYAVDVAVGRIRDSLKTYGFDKNTVIIFTSDNGFFCGSHGYGSKVLPYEESSRVPLLIYDPRHQNSHRALRSRSLTGNIDFAPTILDLAGLPIPSEMDGKSLMPIYSNPKHDIHDSLPLINTWGTQACQALGVITKDFKYIYWNYEEGDFKATEELFHTAKDPHEFKNEFNNPEYQKTLTQMRVNYDKALNKWKQEAVPFHDYQKYVTLFDRTSSWEEKAALLKKKTTKKKK
jgi:arylsulfatase A-like enzyme